VRIPLTILAVAAVGSVAGYAVFRTRGGRSVAAVLEVASWRLGSTAPAGEDRREPMQKLADLLALAATPPSLARDRALYEGIVAMSARDFRALGADLIGLSERFEKLPGDLQGMLAETTMDRWLEIDADGALAWVKAARLIAETVLTGNETLQQGNPAFEGMLRALARHQTDWLLDFARETPAKLGREEAIANAMWNLATTNLSDALRRHDKFEQESDRRAAAQGLLGGWVRGDPAAAAAFALSLPDNSVRDTGVLQAMIVAGESGSAAFMAVFRVLPKEQQGAGWVGLGVLAQSQPATARQLLDELVSENEFAVKGSYNSRSLARSLAQIDPTRTAEWMDGWSSKMKEAVGPGMRQSFVETWAQSNPAAAVAWAAERSRNSSAEQPPGFDAGSDDLRLAFKAWLSDDPPAATAWAEALAPGAVRERAQQALAEDLIRSGDFANAVRSYAAGAARDTSGVVAEQLASALATKDVSDAAEWSRTLAAGAARFRAIKSVSNELVAKDPGAAIAWFGQLAAGPDRDAGASALAAQTIYADPGAAIEWVAQIADPKARSDAAEAVFRTWTWTDPQGARTWLRSLDGVDERWKENFLRRAR
jgi:hypothetical protein